MLLLLLLFVGHLYLIKLDIVSDMRLLSFAFSLSLKASFIFLLLLTGIVFTADIANAQQAGVSITPALIEETLDPGVVKDYSVEIKNLNATDQTFYLYTRNIERTGPGGVPIFAKDNSVRTGYELSDWITLPFDQVDIPGTESVRVDFKMTVPDNASPGGHFGGVFISVEPPEIESSGAAVGYQVANIINIRISGEVIEEANIRQFSTSRFLYGSQNVEFSVRVENVGNVLVRPMGPLEVYNMLGKKVDTIMVNESLAGVFPGATESFDDIIWEGDSIGFGRYEAVLGLVYGEQGARKSITSTVSFWILPMSIIGPALAVLAVILLITFIFVRVYIKRSLAHMSGGRRIVRRRRKSNSSATLLVIVVTLTVTALFLIVLLALFA